jgi:hypothetical protein
MELSYARWLAWGTRAALGVLIACFVVYVLGILEPLVAHPDLVRLWTLPVGEYLAATGAPTGWSWLHFLGTGDYLNLAGIAMLCLVTVLCYARIVPLLAKTDRVYAAIALLQIVVLLAAASGYFSGAH